MRQGTLWAERIGLIPESVMEEGLQRAADYFIRRSLNPVQCYEEYQHLEQRCFSCHWRAAELQANTVLWDKPEFEDTRILLTIVPLAG